MLLALPLLVLAGSADPIVTHDPARGAHLHAVEVDLRAAPVDHLDAEQRAARARLLDVLHAYHEAGAYPHNHVAPEGRPRPVPVDGAWPVGEGETPVFVDAHGTHCAVGYLLAVDGQDALVARIVEGGNLRYVHEIDEPALLAWAERTGFTVEELARIQPAYGDDDRDDDGWLAASDCDDSDPDVNPDAVEVCDDGVDNDCDDEIDETTCEDKGCSSLGLAPVGLLGLLPLVLLRRRR